MIRYDNSGVRRQERLLDEQTALELLRTAEYGVLSVVERRNGAPAAYGLPINYVWDGADGLYFHCAPQGHKLVCADACNEACFTAVGPTHVVPHKFTTAYQSVVVRGVLRRGLPADERRAALALLLDKYSPHDKETGLKYAEKSFDRTEILRLDIACVSGKAKRIAP